MAIYHVIPVHDLKEHDESSTCKCNPTLQIIEGSNDLLVTHNSYDGREGIELANEILKKNENQQKKNS